MGQEEKLLSDLGVLKHYRGYRRTVCILALALEKDERLESITKELYMEAGKQMRCSWKAIEHSVRTVIQVAWEHNPKLLVKIMGYDLYCAPKASEFLSSAVAYLQHSRAGL